MEFKKTRNYEMYAQRLQGSTYAELGRKYNITGVAVREICHNVGLNIKLEQDQLYIAIRDVTDNDITAKRVYRMLRRHGIDTVDEVRELDDAQILKLRHCGPVTFNILSQL